MNPLQAAGRAFNLTHRLWVAILAVLVVSSFLGALATVLLPYEVIDQTLQGTVVTPDNQKQQIEVKTGQQILQAPTIQTPEQFRKVAGPTLILFVISLSFFLYLLGGVIGSLKEIFRGGKFSPPDLFKAGFRWFFPMLGWGLTIGLLAFLAASFFGILLVSLAGGGIRPVSPQEKEALSALPVALYRFSYACTGAFFLLSPIILIDLDKGAWRSFGEAVGFQFRHLFGVIGLFACVVLLGVVFQVWSMILGKMAEGLRQMLGIAPYASGWPVFFFGLLLGIPQAYLSVYFPSALYAYYHGNTSSSS